MQCRSSKVPRVRVVALAVSMALLGALLMAPASSFAAQPSGTACQADGKISGRGATFQTLGIRALINGYQSDVCGPVAFANPDPTETSGNPHYHDVSQGCGPGFHWAGKHRNRYGGWVPGHCARN